MGTKSIAKVIEVVGSSDESWTDAAKCAVKSASKTVKNITGVQVLHMTAQVKAGEIAAYKTTVKIAFGVED
jgi:flavin-binding protein dodecin